MLFLDIETAPNVAYVWGLFDQNIAPNQVEAASYILCWAAKWGGKHPMQFASIQHQSKMMMLTKIHGLLDDADIVVHYNGNKFDTPTLNKEFVKAGILPPSPYQQIDMLRVCRKNFRFESNKLDSITKALGIGGKLVHHGFELWVGCMRNDQKSWAIMERYNRQDVVLLEQLYVRLLPWIAHHPPVHTTHDLACTKCGSQNVHQRGVAISRVGEYQRYQCQQCGSWFRASKMQAKVTHGTVNL